MGTIIQSLFIVSTAFILLAVVYFLVFHFSPFHSYPSIATLRPKAIVAILGGTFFAVAVMFLGIAYDHELWQLFPNHFSIYMPLHICWVVLILLTGWICLVFRFEKRVWLRRNPKFGRLLLQAVNRTMQIEGVRIADVDGITYGQGVSFSWFDGRYLAVGKHKITLEFYIYKKFRRYVPMALVYSKNFTIEVLPGAVYHVEARPERRDFRITRDMQAAHR